MNEALVDACLKVARLTKELEEALAEVESLRPNRGVERITTVGFEAQVKTAPGQRLEQAPHTEGLPPRLDWSQ